jgi:hypothetical protein
MLQNHQSSIVFPSKGCWSHVAGILQIRYKSVTRLLQGCYKGVTRVLQRCYSGVTVVLQWCYSTTTSSPSFPRQRDVRSYPTYVMLCYFILCYVMLFSVLRGCYKDVKGMLGLIQPYNVILCNVISCYVILCCVMLCCVVLLSQLPEGTPLMQFSVYNMLTMLSIGVTKE